MTNTAQEEKNHIIQNRYITRKDNTQTQNIYILTGRIVFRNNQNSFLFCFVLFFTLLSLHLFVLLFLLLLFSDQLKQLDIIVKTRNIQTDCNLCFSTTTTTKNNKDRVGNKNKTQTFTPVSLSLYSKKSHICELLLLDSLFYYCCFYFVHMIT